MKERTTKRLEDFGKLLFPILGAGLFGQLYPTLTTSLVSRRIDVAALSAMGGIAPLSVMQSALFFGLGTGIALVLAMGDPSSRDCESACHVPAASLIIAAVCVGGGMLALCARPLCLLMGIRESQRADCIRYLRVLMVGSGLLTLRTAMVQTFQNAGRVRLSSAASMAGVVLQSCLAILLFLAFPGQIWYVPASTLISNFLVSLALLALGKGVVGSRGEPGRWEWRDVLRVVRRMVRLGLSRCGLMLLIGAGGIVLQRSVNALTVEAVSGHSSANVAINLFMEPLNAIAALTVVYLAREEGGPSGRQALSIERALMAKAVPWCLAVLLLLPFAGRPLLALITGEGTTSPTVDAGYLRLLVCLSAFLPLAIYLSARNLLQVLRPEALYLLGFCEFACELVGAALVPRIGYVAAPACIASAWVLGGAISLYLLVREGRTDGGMDAC